MKKPKVSVIIPVYNTERYLRECLESILGQSLHELEVICVDDDSTDGSLSILKEYEKKDSRLMVFEQENGNNGPGVARNKAIEKASGEYIAFVDSDDYIDVDMLSDLYNNASLYNADIAMCAMKKFTDNYKDKFPRCVYDKYLPPNLDHKSFNWLDVEDVIFNLRFACCNKIYKKVFIDKNNIKFSEGIFYEDLIFTYKALLSAKEMCFVRKYLYFNRKQRIGSTTFSQGSHAYGVLIAMKELEDYIKNRPELHIIIKRFEAFKFKKLLYYLHRNDEEHIEGFYNELKEFTLNDNLDNNPYLTEKQVKAKERIRTSGLVEYLVKEYWDLTTENEFLRRDNSVRKLLLKIKEKVLTYSQNTLKSFINFQDLRKK